MKIQKGIPPLPYEQIERMLLANGEMIQSNMASIYLGKKFIKSGVYAKSLGYYGIVTAGHCAKDFLAQQEIVLIPSEEKHRLVLAPSDFEHVRVDYDDIEGYNGDGADLSFVIIRNKDVVDYLCLFGSSFYDLDKPNPRQVIQKGFTSFAWAVAGNPSEQVTPNQKFFIDEKEATLTLTTSAVIHGNLVGYEMKGKHDYFTVLVGSGFEDYPKSYDGVSGGGIWYQKFTSEDGNSFKVESMLAGIAITQAAATTVGQYRVRKVRGHGLVSIYGHLRAALVSKLTGTDVPI